VKFTGNPYL